MAAKRKVSSSSVTAERTRIVPTEKAQEPAAPYAGDSSGGEIFSEIEAFPKHKAFSRTEAIPEKRQHPSEKAGAKPGKSDVIP